MAGIILSLLAILAALIFAFYADDACYRTDRRMTDSSRSFGKSEVLELCAKQDESSDRSHQPL